MPSPQEVAKENVSLSYGIARVNSSSTVEIYQLRLIFCRATLYPVER